MATKWAGYLIKAVKTNKKFPMKYINIEGWGSTPNQREEVKAYRDDNTRDLHRVTAKGKKSKLAFVTRDDLHLIEKIEIQKFFTDAEELETDKDTAKEQRKVKLKYWNDESNDYEEAYFYRPNMNFTMKKISEDDIIYKEMQFELIEY